MKNLLLCLTLLVASAYADIGNGIETTAFTPVVHLKFNWYTGTSQCTGTQIRPGLILTAAHCVCVPKDSRIGINMNWTEYTQVFSMPGYDCAKKNRKYDVAVIHVPKSEPVSGRKVNAAVWKELDVIGSYPLAKEEARAGQDIFLVGFGYNVHTKTELAGLDGKKRYGTNTIIDVGQDMIEFVGRADYEVKNTLPDGTVQKIATGKDVAAHMGDSGSPMLSLEGEILGTSCASGFYTDDMHRVWYVNVYRDDIRDFLRSNGAF